MSSVFLHVNPWKFRIEAELSVQERKVLASVRHLTEFTPAQAGECARIVQHNHVNVILRRLCAKGFARKLGRGRFALEGDIREYLILRLDHRAAFEPQLTSNGLEWVANLFS